MALPKSWTKVTPLSKALALILFIALPIAGFLLGMQYQRVVDVAAFSQPPDSVVVPSENEMTVTMADNNKTVYAKVGEEVAISLGTNFNWGVSVPSTPALQPLAVAGHYTAVAPGTVIISAVGTPKCDKGKMCPMLAITFKTTLIIK
jgi:hypothetical protein